MTIKTGSANPPPHERTVMIKFKWVRKNKCLYAVFSSSAEADDAAFLFPIKDGWTLVCFGLAHNAYELKL